MIHNIMIAYCDNSDFIIKEYFSTLGLIKVILKDDYTSKATA